MQFLKGLETRVRGVRNQLAPVLYAGKQRYCPICNRSFRKFRKAGRAPNKRPNAVCPACSSRERDRLVFLFLQSLQDGGFDLHTRLLHVAPEPCLRTRFTELAKGGYLSADIYRKDVDEQFDVMSIPYPDRSFSAVFCSHVLQDVTDDEKAIAEFFRILKPGGWAILNVPLSTDITIDHKKKWNGTRSKYNKRPDEYLRSYGPDFAVRFARAGFDVRVIHREEVASSKDFSSLGIEGPGAGEIYYGIKPTTDRANSRQ